MLWPNFAMVGKSSTLELPVCLASLYVQALYLCLVQGVGTEKEQSQPMTVEGWQSIFHPPGIGGKATKYRSEL